MEINGIISLSCLRQMKNSVLKIYCLKHGSLLSFHKASVRCSKMEAKFCFSQNAVCLSNQGSVCRNSRNFSGHNFLCISKTNTFPGMKFRNKSALSEQHTKISEDRRGFLNITRNFRIFAEFIQILPKKHPNTSEDF